MSWVGHGVDHGEKALGQPVGLALTGLIGVDRDQRVVPALGLDRDGHLPDRAGEPAPTRRFLGGRQTGPEKGVGPRDDGVGGEVSRKA